jgi:DNA-binding CsgD family transcriptional regulator
LRKIYFGAETFLMLGFIAFAALGGGRPLLPLGLLQSGAGIFGAYIFTLLLYLGARAGRTKALPVVAAGQMVITGSVLLGLVLTKAVELAALREDIPFVLTASLLGIGLLFFSGFFFRDDRNSFAGYDLGDRDEPFVVPVGEDVLHLRLAKGTLSRQEIRVALFVAQGLSNEEISRQLNITGNTLRTHLRSIHKKMGSSSRKELLDLLLQLER